MKTIQKATILFMVTIAMMVSTVTPLHAAGSYAVSFTADDYDPTQYEDDTDALNEGTAIANGGTVSEGQVFRLHIHVAKGDIDSTAAALYLIYSSDLVEPVIDSDGTALYFPFDLMSTGNASAADYPDYAIFPPAGTSAANRRKTPWELSPPFVTAQNVMSLVFVSETDPKLPIVQDGIFVDVFFRVKDGAAPGSTITFNLDPMSAFNSPDSPITVTPFTLTVAGDVPVVDTSLKSLNIIADGSDVEGHDYMEANFNEDTTEYNLVVPNQVERIRAEVELNDPSTSGVTLDFGKYGSMTDRTLAVGDNRFSAVVKYNGNTLKEYVVNIKRLAVDTGFNLVATDNDGNALTFDNTNLTKVRQNAASVVLSGSLSDSKGSFAYSSSATLSGITLTLNPAATTADTVLDVAVKSESALDTYASVYGNTPVSQNYQYTFRRGSSNVELRSLVIGGQTLTLTSGQRLYTVTLDNATMSALITAQTEFDGARVFSNTLSDTNTAQENIFSGTMNLSVGSNATVLEVRGEDGTPAQYTLNIIRSMKTDNNLAALSAQLDGVEKIINFNADTTSYNLGEIEFSENAQLVLAAAAADSDAMITNPEVLTAHSLLPGTNSFTINVQAQNGEIKNYTVSISMKQNPNSEIGDGSDNENPFTPAPGSGIDAGAIIPDPQPEGDGVAKDSDPDENGNNVYRYTIHVDNTVTQFGLSSLDYTLPANAAISYVSGETISLSTGSNTYEVIVSPQDEAAAKSRYIFTVIRARSANAALATLSSTTAGTWNRTFASNVYTYDFTVASDVSEVVFNATGLNASTIKEALPLIQGITAASTPVIITAVSEDGSTEQVYTITVKRLASEVNTLSELTLDGESIVSQFVSNIYTASFPVISNQGKETVRLEFVKQDSRSTVRYGGNAVNENYLDITLNKGLNTINLEVISEAGVTRTYTLRLTRELDSDASLASLSVAGESVPGFSADNTAYTLFEAVDHEVTSLDVTAIARNSSAQITISGNTALNVGSNTITVSVTAEDGSSTKTYTITVIRKASDSTDLGEGGLQPGGQVDSISPQDPSEVENPLPDHYYYVAYVPYDKAEFTRSDVVIAQVKLDEGYTINYLNDPLTLVHGSKNIFQFTVTSPSGVNTATYNIDVQFLQSSMPHLQGLKINGTEYAEYADTATPIQVDAYLEAGSTRFTVEAVVESQVSVSPSVIQTIDMAGRSSASVNVLLTNTQTGLTNAYTYTFVRTLSKDDSLVSLSIDSLDENGTQTALALYPQFGESTDNLYEILNVPSHIDTIVIQAEATHVNASISGQGEFTIKPGKNIFTLSVQAEDNTIAPKQYQITVYRDLALNLLKIGDVALDVHDYRIEEDVHVFTSATPLAAEAYIQNVTASPNDPSVRLSGSINQQIELLAGSNSFEFTATAQDNETIQKYRVEYIRTAGDDARLATLTLGDPEWTMSPQFNSDTYEYTIDVPYTKETWGQSDFSWSAMHGKTQVQLENSVTLDDVNGTQYLIRTTAESGATQTYTLTIRKEGYNYLSDLHVGQNQGVLKPEFSMDVMDYDATIYAGVTSFRIYYTIDAQYGEGVEVLNKESLENIPVSSLPRNIEVQVQAKNGAIRTYTIYAESGVSTQLQSLTPSEGVLDPVFSANVLDYDIYVADDVHIISLVPIAEDPQATFSGTYENVALIPGENHLSVIVRNGNYQTGYSVTVHRVIDKTGLDSVKIRYGTRTWDAVFSETEGGYTVSVPENVDLEAIAVDIAMSDPTSTYEISTPVYDGNKVHYVIQATDVNGISKSYDLTVERELSDNNHLRLLQVNGVEVVGFDKNQLAYTYKIDSDVLRVTAIAEDVNADVEIQYPSVYEKDEVIRVLVTSAQGNVRTYTITLDKDADNTALLESLTVQEGTLSPQFNPLATDYYLTIPYEITDIHVLAQAAGNGSVVIENDTDIAVGSDHVVIVTVTAENGDETLYRIHVTRSDQADNYLDSLSVSGANQGSYTLSPSFSKETNTYVVNVVDDSEFTIAATAAEGNTITGLGSLTITAFPYIHVVRVVSADNISRNYAIQFIRQPSANANLDNLWTDVGSLDPVFDVNKTAYNIDVAHEVSQIEIFATQGDEGQTIRNTGVHELKPGRNVIEVEVIAEDGSMKTYTVFVNRAQSTAFGLDSLSVSEGSLSPSFSTSLKYYYVNVGADITSIDVSATSSMADAQIEGTGTYALESGSTVIQVTVERERNESATYYVIVNRGEISSTYLAHLDTGSDALSPVFDRETQTYNVDVIASETISIPVNALAEDPLAHVSISGNTDLGPGSHTISIRVERDGLEARIYTINVTVGILQLESNIHTIGETYIETIHALQSVADVKNQMLNPNEYLFIYRNGEVLSDEDLAGTGSIIKLIVNETEYDQKTLIVKGDVNGDGRIGPADIINLRTYILGGALSDAQLLAADINDDSRSGVADLIAIRSHILGTKDIFE